MNIDGKDFLLGFIKKCQSRQNSNILLNKVFFYGAIGALLGAVIEGVSVFVPFYYAHLIAAIALAAGCITGIVIGMMNRKSMRKVALSIDGFGFNERVVTAYENIDKEDRISVLQRENAVSMLMSNQDKVKFKLIDDWRKMALFLSLLFVATGLGFIPSKAKEIAAETHEIKEEANAKIDEINEVINKLDKIDETELTDEEKQALQEMKDMLNASANEYSQVDSKEGIEKAGEKLDYKYNEMSQSLSTMAVNKNSTQTPQGAAVSEQIKEAANTMQQNLVNNPSGVNNQNGQNGQNGNQNGQNGNQNGQNGNQNGQNGNQNGNQNGQNGQNGNQNGQNGNQNGQNGNQNGQNGNQNGQNGNQNGQNGNQNGQNGNQNGQNGNQNGQNGNQNGQNGNQNGQNGNQNGQNGNQNGQNGNQNGQNGNQNGQNGNQNGQNGNQNGQNGNQNGNQNGQGGAGGQGAGTGQGGNQDFDYVSVPKNVGNDENLTGNNLGSDNSQYYQSQNGVAWEGEHVSVDSVLSNYTEKAYEGIDNGKYPTGSEEVIKKYFENFN